MATTKAEATTGPSPGSPRIRSAKFWLACAFLANCAYLGSIGPVCYLTGFQLNGHLNRARFSSRSQRICEVVYWPVCRACEQTEDLSNSVSWYIGLWF